MASPFNPNEPIPNDPFNYERTAAISGPLGPIEVGSGLEITPGGEMIAVGGGPAVTYLTAGAGIFVNANTGSVRVTNTGVLNLAAGTGIGLVRDTNNGTWTITNTAPAVNQGGTVTQVNTGDGLVGGPITTSGTIALSNTGVAPGTYQNATVTVDAKGRVTAAAPGTGISTVSGTNPISVTPGANAIISINEGSPLVPGALRICDAINVSSSSIAASSTAVKNAYDVATAALPCSVLTAQGDLISAAAAGIPVRVPAGADGSFLKVCTACSGTGGLTWDSLTFCEGTVTSVTAGNGLTGGTITASGTIALDTSCVISPTLFTSQGALLTATGANAPTALGLGSNGQLLSANNLCVEGLEWVTPTPSVPCSAFNVKGDFLVATGPATYAALPLGSNGSTLSVNTACASGVEWIASAPAGVTSVTGVSPVSVDSTDPAAPAVSVDAATLLAPGVAQLNDSVSSTSTTEAATPSAVKTAYDEAVSAASAAASAQGDASQALLDASSAQADATQALSDSAAAQGTADQAVLDAAAAQSDATQALTNAAAAQADATQALSDSSAAQADATQALTDAATAQSTANQATLDAAAAQTSANNAFSEATTARGEASAAQSDADQALLDASSAQTAANNAQADATQALSDAASAQSTADQAILDAAAAASSAGNAIPCATFTASGQILAGTGSGSFLALPLGTDGQILTADSLCSGGLKWAAGGGGGGGIPDSTLTAKGDLISATAASTPTALGVGTDGQVLSACSACATGLYWATPQTSPFTTYVSSQVTYTASTPLLVAVWGGGTMQGTVTLPTAAGPFTNFWDFYLSGDATNLTTGWVQTAAFPVNPGDPGYQGSWSVNYPVYPDPNNGQWELYFNPAENSANPVSFTFLYRLINGPAPNWSI